MKNILPALNILHIINDGLQAALLLLLPFIARDYGISLTAVGFLGLAVSFVGVIAALPAGEYARKIGGVRMLIFLLVFYAFGFIGAATASSLFTLWPFFVAAGIGFGVFHPIAFAVLVRMFGKENQGRRLANFTAVGEIGRVILPFGISFLVAAIGLKFTSLIYAALPLFLFAVFYYFRLPQTPALAAPIDPIKVMRIRHLFANRSFVLATVASAIDCFASTSLFVFLPFLFLTKHISIALLGPFTAMFFVGNLLGKTVLGRLTDKMNTAAVFIGSEILMAIFIVILVLVKSPVAIILVSVVLGALTKGTVPVGVAMVADTLGADAHHEKAYSINTMIVGSAITVSPLILGAVSDRFGINAAFYLSAAAALVAILPAGVYWRRMRK